ncbi:hypothetical protein PPROV_000672600 [Pycnococcus provasolii]|uniref:Secreted protein n=1 Tax=Pycnococcus provasolii TaxID=41880 RepID=A0A830HLC9_9CHLO|nr:hypothetical protein PPROV_000672600 [Pycnococcus provasolii]
MLAAGAGRGTSSCVDVLALVRLVVSLLLVVSPRGVTTTTTGICLLSRSTNPSQTCPMNAIISNAHLNTHLINIRFRRGRVVVGLVVAMANWRRSLSLSHHLKIIRIIIHNWT